MGSSWPWTDAVDVSISNNEYGVGLCGPIDYFITDMMGMAVDMINFNGDAIEFAPTLADAPGQYTIQFKA